MSGAVGADMGRTKKEAGLQNKKMKSCICARLTLKRLADIKAEIPRHMTLEFLGEVRSKDKDLRVLNIWDLWL